MFVFIARVVARMTLVEEARAGRGGTLVGVCSAVTPRVEHLPDQVAASCICDLTATGILLAQRAEAAGSKVSEQRVAIGCATSRIE